MFVWDNENLGIDLIERGQHKQLRLVKLDNHFLCCRPSLRACVGPLPHPHCGGGGHVGRGEKKHTFFRIFDWL